MLTAESKARELLKRLEVEGAENCSAGELVELANLISEVERLRTGVDAALRHLAEVRDVWQVMAARSELEKAKR